MVVECYVCNFNNEEIIEREIKDTDNETFNNFVDDLKYYIDERLGKIYED